MAEDQKQLILKAASDLYLRFGIRSVTIEDICHELGMSKKTFYVYFAGKDELVEQLLQANLACMERKMSELLDQEDFRKVMAGFMKRRRERDEQDDVRRVPQLVYDLKKYYPRQFEQFQHEAFLAQQRNIARFLERGIANGLVRANLNINTCATLFAKIYADSVRDLEIMEAHGHNMVQFTQTAMDICIRGVLSEEGLKLYNI